MRTRTTRAVLVAALWCLGARAVDGYVAGGPAALRLRSADVGIRRSRPVQAGVRMAATV